MDENRNDAPHASTVRITRRIQLDFWKTCLLNAAGLSLAWLTTDGSIRFGNALSFALLVVVIWFLNWIVRPVLVVFALPFIVFTIGIGMLFINAFIIYFAAWLVPDNDLQVSSYWAALWASFLVSALSWGLAIFRGERNRVKYPVDRGGNPPKSSRDDDVIDI